MRAILSEPYIHFLTVGLLLYFYYQNFHTITTTLPKQSIVLSPLQVLDINRSSSKLWGRGLRTAELNIMVERFYLDEILLHEAIGLELEKKDREIRNRLITQMRQILASSPKEPSEEALHQYYQKHREDYSITTKISFGQIYLKRLAQRDSKVLVEMLNLKAIDPSSASEYGDSSTHGNQIVSMSRAQISEAFGKYFAGEVWKLRSHRWHGAIHSKDGYHILFITQKQTAGEQPFDEVEDRVYSDYLEEQRVTLLQSTYKKLLTQYKLEKR